MSLCSSISCLACGKLFDETSRKPYLGTCGHSICETCKNKSENCEICGATGAFSGNIVNYSVIFLLQDFRQKLTQENYMEFSRNFESLGHGICSACNCDSRKLRICTVCTTGLLVKLPLSNSTWQVKEGSEIAGSEIRLDSGERVFLKLKSRAICANCVMDEQHEGHEIVKLTDVENISEHLEIRYLLTAGSIVEEKLEDDPEKVRVHRHQLRNRLEELKNLEDLIKIQGLEIYPDLLEAKEKSWQKAAFLNEKNNNLREELFEKQYSEQIEEKLKNLVAEFRKNSFSTDIEYLKFRTIMKELQDAHNAQEENEKKLLEAEDFYYEQCLAKTQVLTDYVEEEKSLDLESEYGMVRQMYIETIRRIIHVELVDKSLDRDKFIWNLLEGSRRKLEAEIMKMRYFPDCDCYFA